MFCGFSSKNMKSMRKHAPINKAFSLVSRSCWNEIPKLSTFVVYSCTKPAHCLLICPTLEFPSSDITWKTMSDMHEQLHGGPLIFSWGSLLSFRMVNLGRKGCQFCLRYPMALPGGHCTSSSWRQHGKQQRVHLRGRISFKMSCPMLS